MSLHPEQEENEMSFLQHLEALRWHLMRGISAIFIFAILAFFNKSILFDTIIFGPKNSDFVSFQFLCDLSETLHTNFPSFIQTNDALCIGQDIPKLQNISMTGQFTSHIMVSLIAGFILAFPYFFWEIWRFIKPGLQQSEVKHTRGVVLWTSILFMLGVGFGYFIISPLSINFLSTYQISESVLTIPTLRTYITTVTTVILASGLLFELPIVVYFFSKIGLITATFLKRYRKHFLVIALILAAIITPPDLFSQILVCIPLMFLYEVSIFISKRVERKETT